MWEKKIVVWFEDNTVYRSLVFFYTQSLDSVFGQVLALKEARLNCRGVNFAWDHCALFIVRLLLTARAEDRLGRYPQGSNPRQTAGTGMYFFFLVERQRRK